MASQPRRRPPTGDRGFPSGAGLAAVVAEARSSPALAETGVVRGALDDLEWAVVDPARHPLRVWPGVPTRARIDGLGAVVATNGPMMGRRIGGRWKVTREVLGALPLLAGATGAAVARRARPRTRIVAGSVATAATAVALLARWEPCGVVRIQNGVDDRRDFDGEGVDHAWIGIDPEGVAIGDGALPDAVGEGCGGLVRLVRDDRVCTDGDAVRLADRRGIAAWGIVAATADAAAVVLVIGSARLDIEGAAAVMQAAGACDAIATDPSGCAFFASCGRIVVGPPRWARRRIQRYGLAMGAA